MKKSLNDLQRLLARKNFADEEELQAYLDSIVGEEVPTLSWDELNDEEKAEELVDQARDCRYYETAMNKLEQALALDPLCINAYLGKSYMSSKPAIRLKWIEKAVEIGRKKFGGAFEEKNIGYYWQLFETRPYMEALYCKAEELFTIGKSKEAIEIAEYMLKLNPSDNQGVRGDYAIWLINEKDFDSYYNLLDKYPDDYSVSHFYNQVLASLLEFGEDETTHELMEEAVQFNPFVIKCLLSSNSLSLPNYYNMQQESGAVVYTEKTRAIWKSAYGAVRFIKKFESKARIISDKIENERNEA